jgi:hypothetical protein
MPKGEKILSPKQKDRTTTTFQKFSNEVLIGMFQIGIEFTINPSIGIFKSQSLNWYLFRNPLES